MMTACCGRRMQPRSEGEKFSELVCGICGDSVYVKKAAPKAA